MRALVHKNSILLKASEGTNFIYRLRGRESLGLNLDQLNAVSSGREIARRINYVRERGYTLEFVGIESGELFGNLQLIDSELPKIMACLVEYKSAGDAGSTFEGLLKHVKAENPLGFDMSEGHLFYEHKIKRFLVASALGMTANEVWTGEPEIGSGVIAIKGRDKLVFYNVYSYDKFESELLERSGLEMASTTRYKFGDLYRDGDDVYIKLNLQVRFA